jgi:hypothetical protein
MKSANATADLLRNCPFLAKRSSSTLSENAMAFVPAMPLIGDYSYAECNEDGWDAHQAWDTVLGYLDMVPPAPLMRTCNEVAKEVDIMHVHPERTSLRRTPLVAHRRELETCSSAEVLPVVLTPSVEEVDCRLVLETPGGVEVPARRCLPEVSLTESLPLVSTPSVAVVTVIPAKVFIGSYVTLAEPQRVMKHPG